MADIPDIKADRIIIMNAPEVAAFLRVSESTIRKLVKERRIPAESSYATRINL